MAIRKVCKWRLLQLLQLEMHRPWLTSASQRSNLQPWGHPEHESCLTFAKRTSTGGGRVEAEQKFKEHWQMLHKLLRDSTSPEPPASAVKGQSSRTTASGILLKEYARFPNR
ncbi:hypothetical protein WJX74_004596 [Apatococcus lobatus]|uniref:Uncharacterized protein n=1 Tax=Apatococcus lobatus TaxID=904363 RepID=A0AAW1S9Z4_9CHLO